MAGVYIKEWNLELLSTSFESVPDYLSLPAMN